MNRFPRYAFAAARSLARASGIYFPRWGSLGLETLILAHAGPLRAHDLAAALDLPLPAALDQLRRLRKRGLLAPEGRGSYRATVRAQKILDAALDLCESLRAPPNEGSS